MLKTVNYVPQNVSTMYLHRLSAPYNLRTQKSATNQKQILYMANYLVFSMQKQNKIVQDKIENKI